MFLQHGLLWISSKCTCHRLFGTSKCTPMFSHSKKNLKKSRPFVPQSTQRSLTCFLCFSMFSLSQTIRLRRKQNKCIHELIAKWNRAQNDMQRYAIARCVAMVRKMIGQDLDYSVRFPKQPACTHNSSTAHTRTHTHTWLSWNELADCSSFMSEAIWMEMHSGSGFPKLTDTKTSCEYEKLLAMRTYPSHHSWKVERKCLCGY